MAPIRRASCDRDADTRLLGLAARQHGIVTRAQAIQMGLTKSMVETRVRRGRLERIHPGVYCVGGAPRTFEQKACAAAAWAGPGAVVSHSSAAYLWRFVETVPRVSDVWAPRRRTRPPPGVRAHFTTTLSPRDRGSLRRVPVTSPARTLIDLAAVLPPQLVEVALSRALVERRITADVLHTRIRHLARQGLPGPSVLRRLLREASGRAYVSTPLERAVAIVLAAGDLPPVRREHPVYVDGGVYYLDFAWPHFRVGVEADSRRWHSDAASFESDRFRHNALTAAGWRVLRVTERQVRTEPGAVRDRVRALLVKA